MNICVYSLIAYEMRVFPLAFKFFFINKPVIISSPKYMSSYEVKEDGEIPDLLKCKCYYIHFLCNYRTL